MSSLKRSSASKGNAVKSHVQELPSYDPWAWSKTLGKNPQEGPVVTTDMDFVHSTAAQQDVISGIQNGLATAWPDDALVSYEDMQRVFRELDNGPWKSEPSGPFTERIAGVDVPIGLIPDLMIYHYACMQTKETNAVPQHIANFLSGTPLDSGNNTK